MICCHGKLDRIDRIVSIRCLDFRKDILAVVQTLEAEQRSSTGGCIQRYGHPGSICKNLLQLELCAFKCVAFRIHLVHIHLVGEGDDKVVLGVLSLAAVVDRRVAAVFEVRLVHIALAAKNRILVQDRAEVYHNYCLVEGLIADLRCSVAPGQGQVELMIPVLCQGICRSRRSVHRHAGDTVEGKARLQSIVEGDVVRLVFCHIVGQCRCQTVRYRVSDIVVCGILPSGSHAGGIIGIHDLLLEGRFLFTRVGEGYFCRCLGTDGSGLALGCRGKSGCRFFFDRVVNSCGQACRCHGLAVLQGELCNTVRKGHVTVGSIDGCIA